MKRWQLQVLQFISMICIWIVASPPNLWLWLLLLVSTCTLPVAAFSEGMLRYRQIIDEVIREVEEERRNGRL